MIKILHAADLHLDSPFVGRSRETAEWLRIQLQAVPEKIAQLCKRERCDLLLLAGDLFDGEYTKEGYLSLRNALEEVEIPTFISPGNHDSCGAHSPWLAELWPSNVHVFKNPVVESVALPRLDCRVYGAGFSSMDCDPLLENFQTVGQERYRIGVFHGDPMQSGSPYNPISQAQVAASNLDYLALGHIHKTGSFRSGRTLCAWPGCPMGRGYDELEEKGVLLVTLDGQANARFLELDTPRFYDWQIAVDTTAKQAVARRLPASGNKNFYRITFTGECEKPNLNQLYEEFSAFPNLYLRDQTQPPVDIWGTAGEDSLEGLYFKMLQQAMEEAGTEEGEIALLAAKLSRKILDGSEVVLP